MLAQHFQKNNKTSYNLVNEYLENPGKLSNITVTGTTSANTESKLVTRSRGKQEQNSSFTSKNGAHGSAQPKQTKINGASIQMLKNSFKSFDKRRAATNLDRRDGSFEDSLLFIRTSSACNKNSNERGSGKTNRTHKVGGSNRKSKKVRQSQNAMNFAKISSNNAVCRIMRKNK